MYFFKENGIQFILLLWQEPNQKSYVWKVVANEGIYLIVIKRVVIFYRNQFIVGAHCCLRRSSVSHDAHEKFGGLLLKDN